MKLLLPIILVLPCLKVDERELDELDKIYKYMVQIFKYI